MGRSADMGHLVPEGRAGAGPHVVVIGGGVIGSAAAAFLVAGGAAVTVVERDTGYGRASSSLSASSIRQQFSEPVNIALSSFGLEYIRGAGVGLREPGYLYLAGDAAGLGVLGENLVVQRAAGADIALLSPGELGARFPWLSLGGVAGGALGLSGEGWFDGPALAERFRRLAREGGARFVRAEAVGMDLVGARVAAVRLGDGERVAADWVVNAAGPYARGVAAMAGVALPVEARRRSVFVVQCRSPLPCCPLVVDTTGVWFRPEGDRFLAGWSPHGEAEAETLELDVDHGQWEDVVWPALAGRVPGFGEARVSGSWAGHYEYNTFDQNGLVGVVPGVDNLVFANGFSGHGMQQSPGVGRGVSELILSGGFTTLDLSDLDVGRVAAGRRVVERNII